MPVSGASPGTLSFRLAGEVEKSLIRLSGDSEGVRNRRGTREDEDVNWSSGQSRMVEYELRRTAGELLAI